MERIMYYKNAIQKLARNIDLVSHPAAIAVISGIFFPHGNVWNAIDGTLLWISMQGSAFFFRALADGMPDTPP